MANCDVFGTINIDDCINGINGVNTIYYIKTSKVNSFTLDTTGHTITAISLVNATATTEKFQEIQVNQNSGAVAEKTQLSLENHASLNEITLSISVGRNDATTRAILNKLRKAKVYVIVKYNDGTYYLLGYTKGGYFTGMDYNSGKAGLDMNGYSLVYTAFENNLGYEISSTVISTIITAA